MNIFICDDKKGDYMRYLLMNAENPLVEFERLETLTGDKYGVLWWDESRKSQLPLLLQGYGVTEEGLRNWVDRRTVSVNRHHMEAVLGSLNLKDKFQTLVYCRGLSLVDAFWVKEKGNSVTFAEVNLYDNPFDTALGWMAFTGVPSDVSRHLSTPELTTVGVLPKYWNREKSNIVLVKGGTSGYANAGLEPFAEIMAAAVAKFLKINSIPYWQERRNEKDVSVCDLFTSKEIGLVTMNEMIVAKYPQKRVFTLEETESLFEEMKLDIKPFWEMCLFDYIIQNGDRHLNNFGFSRNNESGELTGFSPLWDNGDSLDAKSMKSDFPAWFDKDFLFASYDIPYKFVSIKCDPRIYTPRVQHLLEAVNSGKYKDEVLANSLNGESYLNRISLIEDMLRFRCKLLLEEFKNPPKPGQSSKNMKLF